jgi:DNA replication protein DnaC
MKRSPDSIAILLKSYFMPTAAKLYPSLLELAQKEGWSHEDFLEKLLVGEAQERKHKKIQSLLKRSELPPGKTFESLQKEMLPLKIQRKIPALLEGTFVAKGENVLAFGLPGRGKTHFLCALGYELILRHQCRVFFTPVFKLLGRLLKAKVEHRLNEEFKKLDLFDVIILDDIGYVQQNREEMEVLFNFMAGRYERKSLLISSNLIFSQWDKIFKDPMTTMAAIDRVVHHSTILEFDGAKSHRILKEKE